MATEVIPTECSKGHMLWKRNNKDYFCKICGDIDIEELMILTENEKYRLSHNEFVRTKKEPK